MKYFWFGLCIFFLVLGIGLRGAPLDPDQQIYTSQLFGVFSLFLFFLIGLLSWGSILNSILSSSNAQLFSSLGFGSVLYVGIAFIAGELGFIGPIAFSAVIGLTLIGSFLAKGFWVPSEFKKWLLRTTSIERFVIGAISIASMFKIILAFRLHGMTDPLQYHLLGPRLWSQFGEIKLITEHPVTHNAWYWEYLFLWGNSLLMSDGPTGLIEGQLFGQWLHTFIGVFGCYLAIVSLFKRKTRVESWVIGLSAIAALSLFEYSWIAKNDWGVIFFYLFGLFLWFRNRDFLSAGLLFGICLGSKLNAVFWVLPTIAYILAEEYRSKKLDLKLVGKLFLGGVTGLMPMLLRNGFDTGNPVVPFFPKLFGLDLYGPTRIEFNIAHHPSFLPSFDFLLDRASHLFNDHPLFWLFPLLLVTAFSKKNRNSTSIIAICFLVSISWYLLIEMKLSFLRWVGAPLVFSGAFLAWGMFEFLETRMRFLNTKQKNQLSNVVLVSTVCFLFFHQTPQIIRQNSLSDLFSIPPATQSIRLSPLHLGGDSKAWLRINAKEQDRILTTGDNQIYYISHLNVSVATEDPKLDSIFLKTLDAKSFLKKAHELGFKYLLNTRAWNTIHWSRLSPFAHEILSMAPKSEVFIGKDSFVIDIEKAQKIVSKKDS